MLFWFSSINNVLTYLFSALVEHFCFKDLTECYDIFRNPAIA